MIGRVVLSAAIMLVQTQAPVFRGGTDVVALDVTVQDGKNPVLGLKAADFDVRDNGVAQVVTDVTYARLPIDLRLIFDTSGSISPALLADYLRAMTQVTGALQPDDRCDIVAFSARVIEAAALQNPPVTIDLHRAEPNATSFFDAVSLSLITSPAPGRRQLTIVMSDADDNASFFDDAMLTDIAKRTDAVVYAITPMKFRVMPDLERRLKARVNTLASLTGGRVIAADRDVAPAFLNALEEFRKSYVVSYTATGVAREGWHGVTVAVRGSKSYTVRARQGYTVR
ncbi:MAG: VWA domain-containing protein [Vicinamibacterales bacterium]